jgi:hypothetical protein
VVHLRSELHDQVNNAISQNLHKYITYIDVVTIWYNYVCVLTIMILICTIFFSDHGYADQSWPRRRQVQLCSSCLH